VTKLETKPLDAKQFSDSTRAYRVSENGWITLFNTLDQDFIIMHESELEHIVDELRAKRKEEL